MLSNSLFLRNCDLFKENSNGNSKIDLYSVQLPKESFCIAKDALDTDGFKAPAEMLLILRLHPSTNVNK